MRQNKLTPPWPVSALALAATTLGSTMVGTAAYMALTGSWYLMHFVLGQILARIIYCEVILPRIWNRAGGVSLMGLRYTTNKQVYGLIWVIVLVGLLASLVYSQNVTIWWLMPGRGHWFGLAVTALCALLWRWQQFVAITWFGAIGAFVAALWIGMSLYNAMGAGQDVSLGHFVLWSDYRLDWGLIVVAATFIADLSRFTLNPESYQFIASETSLARSRRVARCGSAIAIVATAGLYLLFRSIQLRHPFSDYIDLFDLVPVEAYILLTASVVVIRFSGIMHLIREAGFDTKNQLLRLFRNHEAWAIATMGLIITALIQNQDSHIWEWVPQFMFLNAEIPFAMGLAIRLGSLHGKPRPSLIVWAALWFVLAFTANELWRQFFPQHQEFRVVLFIAVAAWFHIRYLYGSHRAGSGITKQFS